MKTKLRCLLDLLIPGPIQSNCFGELRTSFKDAVQKAIRNGQRKHATAAEQSRAAQEELARMRVQRVNRRTKEIIKSIPEMIERAVTDVGHPCEVLIMPLESGEYEGYIYHNLRPRRNNCAPETPSTDKLRESGKDVYQHLTAEGFTPTLRYCSYHYGEYDPDRSRLCMFINTEMQQQENQNG